MEIIDVAVRRFQTQHRPERSSQKEIHGLQMDQTEESRHIIVGILRFRQTTENIQLWHPKPNRFHHTGIPMIGGVSPHRAEESGDVHRNGVESPTEPSLQVVRPFFRVPD